MKLSILDYAIVDEGKTALEAIEESTELARLAEKLGYSRFGWLNIIRYQHLRAVAQNYLCCTFCKIQKKYK